MFCVSINLPDSLAWNTVAMSGLVVLATTGRLDKLQKQICRTVGPSLAASLKLLLIIEMYPASVFSIGITLVHVFFLFHRWFCLDSFIAKCELVL